MDRQSRAAEQSPSAMAAGASGRRRSHPRPAAVPPLPLTASTPQRHPSVSLDHTPTQSQLNWPSVHRSFSSTGVTRDSSRDPRPSSASVTGGSETRIRGQEDRPRSSATAIPLLVDVAEMGGGNDRSSTLHSHPTTAVCTPREVAATPLPPVEELEAEAERMSREELIAVVESLQTENLVLKTANLRDRDAYATLRAGMRQTYTSVERRQESIANTLMRRLDVAKKEKARLAQSLARVEQEKAREETRLQVTQRNISRLTRHLKREEGEISSKMQEQLQYLQTQRAQLSRMLEAQTSSLHQLERLVEEVQKMEFASGGGGTASPPSWPLSRGNSAIAPSSTAGTPGGPPTKATEPPHQTQPAAAAASGGAPAGGPHQRSSSQLSGSAATPGAAAAAVSTDSVAYNSREMVQYLEQEIAAVEGLRGEVLERAETYAAKARRLEEKLAAEMRNRQLQQRKVQDIKQELVDTSTAVKELNARQELNLEMESERLMNHAARCESLSRRTNVSASAPSTPRGADLSEALLVPAAAKFANPAAVEAFQAARSGVPAEGHPPPRSPQLQQQSQQQQQQQQPVRTVNLADVVLVPGTEKFTIPPAPTLSGAGEAAQSTAAGRDGTDAGTAHAPAAAALTSSWPKQPPEAGGPSLLDALLVPDAAKYTVVIDPTQAATAALMRQVHGSSTGHTPSPSPAPPAVPPGAESQEAIGQPSSTSRICVQDTSRMTPARPLSSTEVTPKKTPSVPGAVAPPLELGRSNPPS